MSVFKRRKPRYPTSLRLPEPLRERLQAQAVRRDKSLAFLILEALEEKYPPRRTANTQAVKPISTGDAHDVLA